MKRCPKETGRLSSPCLPHRFQEGSSSVPNGNQSGSHADSPPLPGESEKKIWAPERPNTLPVWKFRGTRARVSRPLPTRAARSGCGGARLGVGLRHRPGPGFAKSQASAACGGTFAHGHALSAQAARSDPLLSSSSSLATLPNCSRPFHHSQLSRFARAASLPAARPQLGEKPRRPGTPKLPAGFAEQTLILSPPLPSASTPALLHAPILQLRSPEARRTQPFWWDVSCDHLTRDPERKHRGKEKIKKVLPWQPQAFRGQLVGWEGRPLPACRWYSPRLRVFLSNNNVIRIIHPRIPVTEESQRTKLLLPLLPLPLLLPPPPELLLLSPPLAGAGLSLTGTINP